MLGDSQLLAEVPDLFVVKLFAIIRYQGVWNSEPAYDILPYESGGISLGYLRHWLRFYPFCEVVDGD